MSVPVMVQESVDVPVPPADALARTLPCPLPLMFSKWYGPFPPIKSVDQHSDGPWASVGQSRTLKFVGPGSVLETLTHVDRPGSFGYTLSNIKGPMALLVDHIEGVWSFVPNGSGTRVTWKWTLHAKSSVSAPLLPVLGKMWRGYARQSMRTLSGYLQGATV